MHNTSLADIEKMSDSDFFDKEIDVMIDNMNTVTFQFIGIGVAIWIGGALQVTLYTNSKV